MKDYDVGFHIEHENKYTSKGKRLEETALNQIGLKRNGQRYENDFLTGETDCEEDDRITDAKNSYSHDTFPWYEKEIPNKDYWWQGQGYMELTGKRKYRISYFLLTDKDDRDGYDYDHISITSRVKHFEFEYDPKAIEAIKERVALCQKFVEDNYVKMMPAEEDLF